MDLLCRDTNTADSLNETRIPKAIQLLRDPARKIAEIAYAVGFWEPQYFYTIAFKYL